MGRRIERLSALQVAKLTKAGLHPDGGNLYLQVSPGGAKSWVFRYALAGKERQMGLGSLSTFSLADARQRAKEQRKLLADGVDPIDRRNAVILAQRANAANVRTFDQCAAAYIAGHEAGWKNAKHAGQWRATLKTYASPIIGMMNVASVDTPEVMRVLTPIWTSKTETASRLRGRLESILDWACVQKYRSGENPARWRGHLAKLLPERSKVAKAQHHPALPWREMGAFMEALRLMPGTAAQALEFIVLTSCRTGEAIGATWPEIDLDRGLWTIPAARMKAEREHVIPLSAAAVAVLEKARAEAIDSPYIFPARDASKPLSNMACLAVLKRMGRADLTVHGFRSTFRDWAGESTAYPREVIEHALAHKIPDKAEAAYARGTLLEKRRLLMADWARHCDTPRAAGDVVSIRAKVAA